MHPLRLLWRLIRIVLSGLAIGLLILLMLVVGVFFLLAHSVTEPVRGGPQAHPHLARLADVAPTSFVVACKSDHRVLVIQGYDSPVKAFDSVTGQALPILGHPDTLSTGTAPSKFPKFAVCDASHGHLLVFDVGSPVIEVFDAVTFAHLATVKCAGKPWLIALESRYDRIFVALYKQNAIQVFDAATFADLTTIHLPVASKGIAIDPDRGHLIVGLAESLQVYDSGTFAPVASIEVNRDQGGGRLMDYMGGPFPLSVRFIEIKGRPLIIGFYRARVWIFDAISFSQVSVIGTELTDGDNAHFTGIYDVTVDPANGHLLILDRDNYRLQVFDTRPRVFGDITFPYLGTVDDGMYIQDDIYYLPNSLVVAGGNIFVVSGNYHDPAHLDLYGPYAPPPPARP